jgi:hypothetical protein
MIKIHFVLIILKSLLLVLKLDLMVFVIGILEIESCKKSVEFNPKRQNWNTKFKLGLTTIQT